MERGGPASSSARVAHAAKAKRVTSAGNSFHRRRAATTGPAAAVSSSSSSDVVTLVEFYSGMGTMRLSLEAALEALEAEKGKRVRAVAAIDNSDVANAVYVANFPGDRPPLRTNIEYLTLAQLDAPHDAPSPSDGSKPPPAAALGLGGADVWTLSPPCQPYTRKGKKLHGEDPRAKSFLHLIALLPKLANPPRRVLVENVVGFETSATRDGLVAALEAAGYIWREFQMSPHHLGVPYTRERYYLLAKKKSKKDGVERLGGDSYPVDPDLDGIAREVRFRDDAAPATATAGSDDYVTSAGAAGTGKQSESAAGDGGEVGGDASLRTGGGGRAARIGDYLEFEEGFGGGGADDADRLALAALAVPRETIDKYWKWLDVCTPSSRRCQCFTAGYGKTVYGGSVLASPAFVSAHCAPADPATGRHRLLGPLPDLWDDATPPPEVRRFSPREMANLHGLGGGFVLPTDALTTRQMYFTIGNSISVDVVALLLKHLMDDD